MMLGFKQKNDGELCPHQNEEITTPPKFNVASEKWIKMMVGKWISFWEGLFSGAMLNFGSVYSLVLECFVGLGHTKGILWTDW